MPLLQVGETATRIECIRDLQRDKVTHGHLRRRTFIQVRATTTSYEKASLESQAVRKIAMDFVHRISSSPRESERLLGAAPADLASS